MKNGIIILFILSFILLGCNVNEKSGEKSINKEPIQVLIIWVGAQKVENDNPMGGSYYGWLIKTEESDNWEFCDYLEGFDDYVEGYEYKIKVEKIVLDPPIADYSSFYYKFIEIISQIKL